jgi:hypothetical protein
MIRYDIMLIMCRVLSELVALAIRRPTSSAPLFRREPVYSTFRAHNL